MTRPGLVIPLSLVCSLTLLAACGDDTAAGTGNGTTSGTTSGADSGSGSGSTGSAGSTSIDSESAESGPQPGSSSDGSSGSLDGASSSESDSSSSGEPLCDPEDVECGCDETDDPDINGNDDNGDGIDGLAFCSVFVSTLGGDDGNSGLSMREPVATIAQGIAISQTFDPPRAVLIAEGTYAETVTLGNGTSLYGGYDASSWSRNILSNEVTIEATEDRGIIANDIDQLTEVDGVTVVGSNVAGPSASTYAVWVNNAAGELLHFDYCNVVAGVAGDGDDGMPGSPGPAGGNGDPADQGDAGVGGVSACGASGGNGGHGDVCPSEDGLPGLAGGDPTAVGAGGFAGSSNCGGCFDSATPGFEGQPGSLGLDGFAGIAPTDVDGEFSPGGLWSPELGSDAGRGLHGGGGGGGGAGGFDSDPFGCDINLGEEPCSGGGGGGGAGGCGGEAGLAAGSGGGSFAMVVIASEIQVTNTDLFLGNGGNGGDGGDGGNGGLAGVAGAGAPPCGCTNCGEEPEPGADGGDGGGGGGGGGGPGGCAGVSIGIASVGATAVTTANVSFSGGTAGVPGAGGAGGLRGDGSGLTAPDGEPGCAGVVADEQVYP